MRNPLFAATVVVLTCLMAVSQNTPVTQNTAAAQPKVAVQPIGEPAFTVPAGTFKDYTFAVPEGLKKVGVFGHFKATGGPHNDIVVLVMTDERFVSRSDVHQPPGYTGHDQADSSDRSRNLSRCFLQRFLDLDAKGGGSKHRTAVHQVREHRLTAEKCGGEMRGQTGRSPISSAAAERRVALSG